jgi:tetratricopeptide (TPR) repeat protein
VREYAAEGWQEAERHGFRRRHAEYYCFLAKEVDQNRPAAEITAHLDRLEREHDHLRAAVDWAVSQGDAALAWRLGAALGGFWQVRGYWREGRRRLAEILAVEAADAGQALSPLPILVERAHTLDRAADLALMQNDDGTARELYEQSLALYRRLGDEAGAAFARTQLGNMARRREEFATARSLLGESLRFYEERGDRASIGWVLSCLGQVAEEEGDHPAAIRFYRQSLAIWRERNDPAGVVHALECLGRVLYLDGDYAAARALFTECLAQFAELRSGAGMAFTLYALGSLARLDREYERAVSLHREALELYRELGDESSIAGSLAAVAYAIHAQEDSSQAATLFQEALQINRKRGNRRQMAHCLEGLAGIAARAGCWQEAARLFGAADTLRKGDSPRWPADQADYERNLAALQAGLEPAALAAARAEGAALPLDEAIALALAVE